MSDDMTPGAERAVAAAHHFAAGQPAVLSRHLLMGLWSDRDSPAVALARQCQFDPGGWVPPVDPAAVPVAHLSIDAELCLRAARRLARNYLVDRIVTTELLLVAIFQTDSSLAAELSSAGFQIERLVEQVLAPLTTPVPLADLPEPQFTPADRILDVNANRAREALRVVEEYARFVCDDGIVSGFIKELRHDLAKVLAVLPQPRLIAARDTTGDVGVTLEGRNEYARGDVAAVVAANLKRLQEALRCLEEYGKLSDTAFARQVEQLRYRSYTVAKALIRDRPLSAAIAAAKLYLLVSAGQCRGTLEETVTAALAGGVQAVQLREKNVSDRETWDRARLLRRLTRSAGALFIINDRPDLARLAEADGVHLGQDDLPVGAARRLVGPLCLIGVSTHNPEQLKQAVLDGADYVGVGPTFPSGTKTFDRLAGLEYVRHAAGATSLPSFALGGITLANLAEVVRTGIGRVAVSGAIAGAADALAVAREFRQRLDATG